MHAGFNFLFYFRSKTYLNKHCALANTHLIVAVRVIGKPSADIKVVVLVVRIHRTSLLCAVVCVQKLSLCP